MGIPVFYYWVTKHAKVRRMLLKQDMQPACLFIDSNGSLRQFPPRQCSLVALAEAVQSHKLYLQLLCMKQLLLLLQVSSQFFLELLKLGGWLLKNLLK
jgi:hypothetical protein